MSQYTTYGEFLNQSYRSILEACLADEAIDTLKILENKDYLLLRINELFTEIYVAQREKTIQEQANIISSLQKNHHTSKILKKEEKCMNCELMKEHIQELEDQIRQFEKKASVTESTEEKSVKKIESLLLKEIEQLKKELKGLQEEIIYKKIEFEQDTEKLHQENERLKSSLKQESEKNDRNAEKLKSRVKQMEQEKEMLENQVFNHLQSRGKEEKDIRELNAKYVSINIARERQQNENSLIRNENSILQQKLKRLQEENHFLKQKNAIEEREMKNLKKKVEQIQFQNQNLKNKAIQSAQINEEEPFSLESLNKRNENQRKNLQSEKYIQALKQQLAQKQAEFSSTTVQNEKMILKLTDQLRKAQTKMQKELKSIKDECKRAILKNTQDLETVWKQQKQQLTTGYEKLLTEKESLCERSQQKILLLNRNLIESQQSASDTLKEFQQQKNRLLKQIEQQKHNYNELKKFYKSERATEEVIEKENGDKCQELLLEKKQIQKLLSLKEKEIRDFKKEILRANERENSLQIKIEDAKNKCSELHRIIDEQRIKSKAIAQKLKEKDRDNLQLHHKYTELVEEGEDEEKKIASFAANQRRLEEKVRRLESQLGQKRELLLSMHEANQSEVIDVFAKAQQTTAQARKQLQSYYLNLLKSSEERNSNATAIQIEKLQEEELERLKLKNSDYEEKLKKYKKKYSEEEKQKISSENRFYALIQQNQQLKGESSKALDLVHLEKKKNLNIIKVYQQKMLEYYNNFSEFKRQFYLSLKQELVSVRQELYQIVQSAKQQKIRMQEYIGEFSEKVLRETELLAHRHQLEIQRIRHEYEYERILKIEEEKREIKMECQVKLKEQSMEFYTIMAEKQHQINTLTEREGKMGKRMSEIEIKNDQVEKLAKETYKKNEELKDIISKMNSKVTESERTSSSTQNELDFYRRANVELKKQISDLQTNFKGKIEECRQKYSLENERLFAKYQKEFSKFIVSNKKSLEFSMLSSSCNNLHVPTKGAATQGKLDKIQKEIEQQKRKLNLLERGMQGKSKLQKTSKMGVERDNPRSQKSKKY